MRENIAESAAGARLLVVDDEPELRDALSRALRLAGYRVAVAADGRSGLGAVATDRPDLVVLDVRMPDMGGIEVCRTLRKNGDGTPVLMLTALDGVRDRVAGLDAGADDYLVKPFALEELFARVRALLRRTPPGEGAPPSYADLTLLPHSRQGRRGERVFDLTRTEYALLDLLLRNAGQVLRARSSSTASGVTPPRPAPTRWRSTSATCAARPKPAANPASSRPSTVSATACVNPHERLDPHPAAAATGPRRRSRSRAQRDRRHEPGVRRRLQPRRVHLRRRLHRLRRSAAA